MSAVYKHKGADRPLIHIPNFGRVYLKEGDTLTFEGTYVYHSTYFNYPEYHRHLCYISNILPYPKYPVGLPDQEVASLIIEDILNRDGETPLERQDRRISEIASRLPERDLIIAKYNFTNNFRPTEEYKYIHEEGLYFRDEFKKCTKQELSWHMYMNLYRLLPEGVEGVNAEQWEELDNLFND